MGKSQQIKKKNKEKKNNLPFVSICTPTFNRRPFINNIISCFNSQDYPKDKLEWIIIDDGTDKIEDLVCDISLVKYYKYDKKMPLGEKRNIMHEKSKGDILVYMDDDDFYPPNRVSHAVEKLLSKPEALCAGSSEIYIYFKHISRMYKFGPYGPNHATAGTFAFKRELLKNNSYENTACLAEEKHFLKNYTVPFVQLDPLKTILVFSHEHNTFDKRELLKNKHPDYVKESAKTVDMFIKNETIRNFFLNELENLLLNYEPGEPKNKPDVIKQTEEIRELREKENQNRTNSILNTQITIQNSQGQQNLTIKQCLDLLQSQFNDLTKLKHIINSLNEENKSLKNKINTNFNTNFEKNSDNVNENNSKNEKIINENNELKKSINNIKNENLKLENDFLKLENENLKLINKNTELINKNNDLDSIIKNKNNEITILSNKMNDFYTLINNNIENKNNADNTNNSDNTNNDNDNDNTS